MNDKNEESQINQQAIFDIIQNIQEKMGSTDKVPKENIHIDEVSKEKSSSSINNSSPSLQNILGNLDLGKISSLLGGLGQSTSETNKDKETGPKSSSSDINFDMNTIFKIQKIMGNLNKDDPKKNLLLSLKPFLRKTRQDKLDTYVSLLSIWNVVGMFSESSDIL